MDCFKKVLKYNAIAIAVILGIPGYIAATLWLSFRVRDLIGVAEPWGMMIWLFFVAITIATIAGIVVCLIERDTKKDYGRY
ncbi:MAG: hypothetical protein ACXV2C_00710 [Candidatus Bathyarchaeia archaeon]